MQNATDIPLPDPDYVATATARNFVVTITPRQPSRGVHPQSLKVVVSVATLTTNDPTAVDAKGALVATKLASYTRVITVSAGAAANRIVRMWFRSSGCDPVAKRLSVLLKRRALRVPLTYGSCSPSCPLSSRLLRLPLMAEQPVTWS